MQMGTESFCRMRNGAPGPDARCRTRIAVSSDGHQHCGSHHLPDALRRRPIERPSAKDWRPIRASVWQQSCTNESLSERAW